MFRQIQRIYKNANLLEIFRLMKTFLFYIIQQLIREALSNSPTIFISTWSKPK